jgi:dihydrofolate reductase
MKKQVKYTAYVATSIDGRISESRRSKVDWASSEDWAFFQKALKGMDVVVVGYNTYKVSENRIKRRNAIVLTSKVNMPKTQGLVVFLNPKKSDLKKFIQSKNYKKVAVIGGPQVYNFCLENKMLDELFVTIEPYVFTSGVPMFSGKSFKKHNFTLLSVKKLNKTGTILLHYKKI